MKTVPIILQGPRVRSHHLAVWCLAMALLVSSGCSWFKRSEQPGNTQPIPLTPAVWFSPSASAAVLPYQNACGEEATHGLGDPFVEVVSRKLKPVFTDTTTQHQSDEAIASEGVIEVGIGSKRIDLTIPEKGPGTYPAKATVGVEMIVLARDGTLLLSKKLQGTGLGMVEVAEQSCDVHGLGAIVQSAIDSVADDMTKQLLDSAQIRDYAAQRDSWLPLRSHARPSLAASAIQPGSAPVPTVVPEPVPPLPIAAVPTQAMLSYRAIIRDENRDHVLQPDESVMVEIEVKNEGPVEANDVKVTIEGKPELTALFPKEIVIGALQPGEIRRTAVTKQVVGAEQTLQGELVLKLRTTTPMASAPPRKIFLFGRKPKTAGPGEVLDVDQIPSALTAIRQPKGIVIAIGIEKFSDGQMSSVKYASHDAEVMAEYLRMIGNIPADRVRVLLDEQATKRDLEETFGQWLPKRADPDAVVYIFFAGRALVDGATGSVSLAPYDGTSSMAAGLYPVQQLQQALYRLPIQRGILMFDVSVDPMPGADLAVAPTPQWGGEASRQRKDREMWMIGNRGLQEAHIHEQGKHGLFTYYLLRGLQGVADVDRDGVVVAGELCTYVRGQVARLAREQFGTKQDPLCLPSMGLDAMIRIHPLAKGNNPKPAPPVKQPDIPTNPPMGGSPGFDPQRIGP